MANPPRAMRTLFLTAALASSLFALAQDNTSKGVIEIEINENGNKRVIRKEFDPSLGQDVNALLREMDVLQDLDLKKGENVEINVKKSVKGKSSDQVDVLINDQKKGTTAVLADRPLLGVYITTFNNTDGIYPGGTKGAKVDRLVSGSAAEAAGLVEGDIITHIDGKAVQTDTELRAYIGKQKPGQEVSITYLRNGAERTTKATLGLDNEGLAPRFRYFNFDTDDLNGMILPEEFEERMRNLGSEIEREVQVSLDGRAQLGVTSTSRNQNTDGARVDEVIPGTAAEEMGLRTGDVITAVNGKKIKSFDELATTIKSMRSGDAIALTVKRGNSTETLNGNLKPYRFNNMNPFAFNWNEPGQVTTMHTRIRMEIQDLTPAEEAIVAQGAGVDLNNQLNVVRIEFAPNPSEGTFTIDFELPQKERTAIMILNSTGAKLREEILGDFSGTYRKTIDLTDQPNGVYFVVIAQGEKQFTRKLVKQD